MAVPSSIPAPGCAELRALSFVHTVPGVRFPDRAFPNSIGPAAVGLHTSLFPRNLLLGRSLVRVRFDMDHSWIERNPFPGLVRVGARKSPRRASVQSACPVGRAPVGSHWSNRAPLPANFVELAGIRLYHCPRFLDRVDSQIRFLFCSPPVHPLVNDNPGALRAPRIHTQKVHFRSQPARESNLAVHVAGVSPNRDPPRRYNRAPAAPASDIPQYVP
jgi:hypothetical protein